MSGDWSGGTGRDGRNGPFRVNSASSDDCPHASVTRPGGLDRRRAGGGCRLGDRRGRSSARRVGGDGRSRLAADRLPSTTSTPTTAAPVTTKSGRGRGDDDQRATDDGTAGDGTPGNGPADHRSTGTHAADGPAGTGFRTPCLRRPASRSSSVPRSIPRNGLPYIHLRGTGCTGPGHTNGVAYTSPFEYGVSADLLTLDGRQLLRTDPQHSQPGSGDWTSGFPPVEGAGDFLVEVTCLGSNLEAEPNAGPWTDPVFEYTAQTRHDRRLRWGPEAQLSSRTLAVSVCYWNVAALRFSTAARRHGGGATTDSLASRQRRAVDPVGRAEGLHAAGGDGCRPRLRTDALEPPEVARGEGRSSAMRGT